MNQLNEGKKWNAVKAHVKKNKKKYLLGAAAAGLGGLEAYGHNLQKRGYAKGHKIASKYRNKGEYDRRKYKKEMTPTNSKILTGDIIKPSSWVKNIMGTSTREERLDKLSTEYANKYGFSTKSNVLK